MDTQNESAEIATPVTPTPPASKRPRQNVEEILKTAGAIGLPHRELAAFHYFGRKGGRQIAIAKGKTAGKIYVYRMTVNDVEDPDGFIFYTPEERLAHKMGGITAEINLANPDGIQGALTAALMFGASDPGLAEEQRPRMVRPSQLPPLEQVSAEGPNGKARRPRRTSMGPVKKTAAADAK
jgi:hypothetical protein